MSSQTKGGILPSWMLAVMVAVAAHGQEEPRSNDHAKRRKKSGEPHTIRTSRPKDQAAFAKFCEAMLAAANAAI